MKICYKYNYFLIIINKTNKIFMKIVEIFIFVVIYIVILLVLGPLFEMDVF